MTATTFLLIWFGGVAGAAALHTLHVAVRRAGQARRRRPAVRPLDIGAHITATTPRRPR